MTAVRTLTDEHAENGEVATMTTPVAVPSTTIRETFSVSLKLLDGYAFRVEFDDDWLDAMTTDEASPLGEDRGPAPSRLLATAIANCLAASLLHCLRKGHVSVDGLEASAVTTLKRNDRDRLRIARIDVRLDPRIPSEQRERLSRCVSLFEDYCIVTQSVREGIEINVSVAP